MDDRSQYRGWRKRMNEDLRALRFRQRCANCDASQNRKNASVVLEVGGLCGLGSAMPEGAKPSSSPKRKRAPEPAELWQKQIGFQFFSLFFSHPLGMARI